MTRVIKNAVSATVSTNVPMIDVANYQLLGSYKVDGGWEAIYNHIGADPLYPASLRVGIYPNSKTNRTNFSVKIVTRAVETDGGGEVISDDEVTATLALSVPGVNGLFDLTSAQQLLFNLVGATYQTAAAGTPSTAVLSKWNNMIPSI